MPVYPLSLLLSKVWCALEEEEKKRLAQPSSMMEEDESDPEQCPFHAEYLCRTYWLAGLLEVRPI